MSQDSEIKVIVDGKRKGIPYASFNTVLSNMVGILKSLAHQVDTAGGDISWRIVSASMNSPLEMTIIPVSRKRPTLGRRVSREYIQGMQALEQGHPDRSLFSGEDMKLAKRMVNVLNDGVRSLVFESPVHGFVKATQHLAANVDAFYEKLYRYEMTSFRGRLENVNTHADDYHFEIFDILTDHRITCRFEEEDIERVGANLRKRVYVYGRAKYEKDTPVSIHVKEFRSLDENIVKLSELPGVNITDGMDAADYVRAIRNGENI